MFFVYCFMAAAVLFMHRRLRRNEDIAFAVDGRIVIPPLDDVPRQQEERGRDVYCTTAPIRFRPTDSLPVRCPRSPKRKTPCNYRSEWQTKRTVFLIVIVSVSSIIAWQSNDDGSFSHEHRWDRIFLKLTSRFGKMSDRGIIHPRICKNKLSFELLTFLITAPRVTPRQSQPMTFIIIGGSGIGGHLVP
jgi:hypothetical protein